jgi:hypothetical protein
MFLPADCNNVKEYAILFLRRDEWTAFYITLYLSRVETMKTILFAAKIPLSYITAQNSQGWPMLKEMRR